MPAYDEQSELRKYLTEHAIWLTAATIAADLEMDVPRVAALMWSLPRDLVKAGPRVGTQIVVGAEPFAVSRPDGSGGTEWKDAHHMTSADWHSTITRRLDAALAEPDSHQRQYWLSQAGQALQQWDAAERGA